MAWGGVSYEFKAELVAFYPIERTFSKRHFQVFKIERKNLIQEQDLIVQQDNAITLMTSNIMKYFNGLDI